MIDKIRKFVKFDSWNEENIFICTIIGLAIVLGSIARIQFISGSLYPINDGGLFFQMTEDLLGNQLALPKYSTYNQNQIPFAYPPLAFYVTALIHQITDISLINLLRILPCAISILTLPAFYYLSEEILPNKFQAALSLFFFAMVPRAFEWFVMGGGITRSLGFLFAVLALGSIWRLFNGTTKWIDRVTTILFSSLTVLAHPEAALFVIFATIIIYIYHKPNRTNTISSIIVGFGVILITLPWTGSVFINHGLGPFLGASATGHASWFEIKNLLTLNFGFENSIFLSIYGVFALIGVFSRHDRFSLFLLCLLLLGYCIFPRSGVNLLTIVISILAAFGLIEILILLGRNGKLFYAERNYQIVSMNLRTTLFFAFVLFYLFLGAFTYKFTLSKDQLRLTEDNMQSFAWIEKNTRQTDQIMFYPMNEDNRFWWNDFLAEWAPPLTGRISVTTVQGSEWLPSLFEKKIDSYIKLRSCANTGPVCVRQWEIENQTRITYLVIDQKHKFPDFVNSFKLDNLYNVVYELDSMIILSKAY